MSAYSTGYKFTPGNWSWPTSSSKDDSASPVPPSAGEDAKSANSHESSTAPRTPRRRSKRWLPRTCRICLDTVYPQFSTEVETEPTFLNSEPSIEPTVHYESEGGRLIRPCLCKGSSRYVHEDCLQQWRHADPSYGRRNYWECPTCHYKYRLGRMQWSRWLRSQVTQIGLTILIFFVSIFLLGFVADPIINLYFDPVDTIISVGQDSLYDVHFLDEDEEIYGWLEHFLKGIASLGLIGFIKMAITMGPISWFQLRSGTLLSGTRTGSTGRDRITTYAWIAILVGVFTFLYTIWKFVRRWSRRVLEKAGERVLDVQGDDDNDDDDDVEDDSNDTSNAECAEKEDSESNSPPQDPT